MADFDELNEEELVRLQAVGREYERLRPLSQHEVYFQFTWQAGSPLGEAYPIVTDWDTIAQNNPLVERPKGVGITGHNLKRWADCGYVDIASSGTNSFGSFMLVAKGRAYLAYQAQPKWKRQLDGWWAERRPETRGALVGALLAVPVGALSGAAASLLFTWLALRLGWIKMP
jgi:hypothetical protein